MIAPPFLEVPRSIPTNYLSSASPLVGSRTPAVAIRSALSNAVTHRSMEYSGMRHQSFLNVPYWAICCCCCSACTRLRNSYELMSDVRSCVLRNIIYLQRVSNIRLMDKFTDLQPRPPTNTAYTYTLYSIHDTILTGFKSMQSSTLHTSPTTILSSIHLPSS